MNVSIQSEINRISGEVDTQEELIAQIAAALEGKAGGASAPNIGKVSVTPSSNSTSISFSGLSGEPKMFSICPTGNVSLSSSSRYVTGVQFDGSTMRGLYSNNSTATHSTSYFTKTYSNGTLTIRTSSSTNGGYFRSGVAYQLVYVS